MYVRQLSISLRNAVTLQKKESIQSVYNWQFVHSLHLWVQLLCATHPSPHLGDLVYPVAQGSNTQLTKSPFTKISEFSPTAEFKTPKS